MTPELWEKVSAALDQFSELSEQDRALYLEQLHRDEPEVAVEVDLLLQEQNRSDSGAKLSELKGQLCKTLDRGARSSGSANRGSASSEHSPIQQLGDFRILREIGRGGMGIVYEAEQITLGRRVALKVLPGNAFSDDYQKQRFEREAKAAAKLHHTNIVPVFGVGEHDGTPYYVMQCIQGPELGDVIKELARLQADQGVQPGSSAKLSSHEAPTSDLSAKEIARSMVTGAFHPSSLEESPSANETSEPLQSPALEGSHDDTEVIPLLDTFSQSLSSSGLSRASARSGKIVSYWHSVARIGAQVASALEHAHKQKILHRDIKPSNLLLDVGGMVWVTDFGLAKIEDQKNLTNTGDVLGTLRYMPPEAFQGISDARGDIYSLGLTLYELAALRPAFDEKENHKLILQVTTTEPERLERINRKIPRDLVTIIHKAIDSDPGRRYQTAGELEEDLQRFLEDEPIRARRVSRMERFARWRRRNPGLAISMLLIFVLLSVGVIISTVAAFHFQEQEKIQKNLANRNRQLLDETTKLAEQKEEERKRAQKEAIEKTRAQQEALDGLIDACTSYGLFAAERDKVQESVLWFATAASVTPPEDRRSSLNRLRFRNWLRTMPVPIHAIRNPLGNVTDLTIHPNNQHVLIHTSRGTVVWGLQSGEVSSNPGRHITWSPDGSLAAISSVGGVVEIQRFPGKHRLFRFQVPGEGAPLVTFSRNGKLLAAGSQVARIWNLEKETFVRGSALHPEAITSLQFSEDNGCLITTCRDGKGRVFEHAASQLSSTPRFTPVPHRVSSRGVGARFFPPLLSGDGQALFAVRGNTLQPVDLETGKPGSSFSFETTVLNACVNRKNQILSVSLDFNGAIQSIDLRTGKNVSLIEINNQRAPGLALHPRSNVLATVGHDSILRFWDPGTGEPARIPSIRNQGKCEIVILSPDGSLCAVAQMDQTIRLLRMPVGSLTADAFVPLESRGLPYEPSLDHQGRYFVPFGARWSLPGRQVLVYETATGKPCSSSLQMNADVISTVLSPEGRYVAVASGPPGKPPIDQNGNYEQYGRREGYVRVWDWQKNAFVGEPIKTRTLPLDVAYSPNGKMLVVACAFGNLLLIDTAQLRVCATMTHPGGYVYGFKLPKRMVRYSHDGDSFISAGFGNRVRMWTKEGKLIAELPHRSFVNDVRFSATDKLLVTAGDKGNVQVWEARTGSPLGRPMKHPDRVTSASFDPDGKRVVSTSEDGMARVWDWRAGRLDCPALKHSNGVFSAAFHQDGTLLVTTGDGEIRFWETNTGKEIAARRTNKSYEPQLAMNQSATMAVVTSSRSARMTSKFATVYHLHELSTVESFPLRGEHLQLFAEIVSARRMAKGGSVPITSEEWMARWKTFQKAYPAFGLFLLEDLKRTDNRESQIARLRKATELIAKAQAQMDKQKAQQLYEQALAISQEHPAFARSLGDFLFSDATASARRVQWRDYFAKRKVDVWTYLGAAYHCQEDWQKALRALERGGFQSSKPSLINLLLLALTHQEIGHIQKAREKWNQALTRMKRHSPDSFEKTLAVKAMRGIAELSETESHHLLESLELESQVGYLTERIQKNPKDASAYRARGNRYAIKGRWKNAAEDLLEATRLQPEVFSHWRQAGHLLLYLNDHKRFRLLCKEILQRFGSTGDPATAERIAKLILMDCDFTSEHKPAVALAYLSLKEGANQPARIYYESVVALAELREKKFAESEQRSRKSLTQLTSGWNPRFALQMILVIVLAKQEKKKEARDLFQQAVTDFQKLAPTAESTGNAWHDWLLCQILRREAELLLND